MWWLLGAALAAGDDGWAGAWEGRLSVGAASLRLGFTLVDAGDGLTGTLQSPDQGAMAVPLSGVRADGDDLVIEVASVQGRYAGTRRGDTVEGSWTQGLRASPLVLHRVDAVLPNRRPQDPTPPFPYREEEVVVPSDAPGIALAGTWTVPAGAGPFPAVALVTGSGPQDRDEALMGHRPFAVLADHLARHGIAVLRYDDRGVGRSTGAFEGATTDDFALDAAGAARWLRGRPEVGRIGLVGHSEGAMVGPIVARDHPDRVDLLVLIAGPAVPGAELLAVQGRRLEQALGVTGSELDRLDRERRARIADALAGHGVPELSTPWMRRFLAYDPVPALRAVRCPTLALFGSLDLQVAADQSEAPMRAALAGSPDPTVTVLAGLNHLMQPATTGGVDEYARIETTLAPAALDAISGWLLAHAATP